MTVLITGAAGFVGKNLSHTLNNMGVEVLVCTRDTAPEQLEDFCARAEFVFHLAGVNRPEDPAEYLRGNADFTAQLLEMLARHRNACPVLLASSVHAAGDSPYGKSKAAAERLAFAHGQKTGAKILVYRLPNLFGKWSKPYYNSVVATFCHNIARRIPVSIDDPARELELAYIDDVVAEFTAALVGGEHRAGDFCTVPVTHRVTVGEIATLLAHFRDSAALPSMEPGSFEKKLFSTYLSYLPEESIATPLLPHADSRGSFTELLRTENSGQFSVNITRPGVTRGNHWHHSKWEIFLVVAGESCIRQRKLGTDTVITTHVRGEEPQAVRILPGYVHSITNLSSHQDLVTLIWANEPFDPADPDTFYQEVEPCSKTTEN